MRERLADHVFVAHNARFDYGFIKNEFRRLEVPFTADVLCTVRLSRKLYPEAVGDSLDADVAGAAQLGMRTAWLTRRVRDPEAALREYEGPKPDHVIVDLRELEDLLD